MKSNNPGYWFIILILAVVGIASWRVYFKNYRQTDAINIHHFPKVIEGWTSEELPVSDDEKALLETDNVFVRRYTRGNGDEVYLFIVYSQNNRKVSHPPEICYTGGGATILDSVSDSFISRQDTSVIPVKRLTVEIGNVRQIFMYWLKAGSSLTSNYWKQQAMIAKKSLLGQPSSSALIRVSSTVHNGDDEQAVQLIKEFGSLILPHIWFYLL